MENKEDDMDQGNRSNGWIPDKDDPDNDYIRAKLLEAGIKRAEKERKRIEEED